MPSDLHSVEVAGRVIPVRYVSNKRARKFILRFSREGEALVTVPAGSTIAGAAQFLRRHLRWLARRVSERARFDSPTQRLGTGSSFLFRGQSVALVPENVDGVLMIRLGTELITVTDFAADLRPEIEAHLRSLAARELPERVLEGCELLNVRVNRVTVRSQRTRWGSCSRNRTISLNWRLIQTPPDVQNYIVIHELAHIKEMNHSNRFWNLVEEFCPDYGVCEEWLRKHSWLLH